MSDAFSRKVGSRNSAQALTSNRGDRSEFASEEAVRAAAKSLINTALGYAPPHREAIVQRSLVWTEPGYLC